jgi:hypothetical protein
MLKEGSSLLLGAGPARIKMHDRKILEMLVSVTPIPMIFSIDTGKARPSRAGRADWNFLFFWDRAQVLESEI